MRAAVALHLALALALALAPCGRTSQPLVFVLPVGLEGACAAALVGPILALWL